MAFFGTSPFAIPSLDALAAAHDVRVVVTQPDRPAGRGLERRPSPVKVRALALDLDVQTPERLDAPFIDAIARLRPQLLACISYGKILPKALLEIDGMTALNVHPSLLPEYRGAAPIQTALRDGRTTTGVSIIWMNARMDEGDLALTREIAIAPDENYGALHDRLAHVGAAMLAHAADLLARGALPRTSQDHARATYTKPVSKDDLRIDAGRSARSIVDLVRSASPAPAAWTIVDGKRLKVLEARVEPRGADVASGDGPTFEAADGIVRFVRVVPEGKRAMSGAEYLRTRSARS